MATTVLSLAGGGSRGIWQAGSLQYILDAGIKYDVLLGASVGALNGSFLLGGSDSTLADVWCVVRSADVLSWAPWKLLTPDACFYDISPLRQWIPKHIDFNKLVTSPVPFHISYTSLADQWKAMSYLVTQAVNSPTARQMALNVLVASASAPIAFAPERLGGTLLTDGGVMNDYGIAQAVDDGADRIICIGPTVPIQPVVNNVVDMLQLAIGASEYGYLYREMEYAKSKGVKVILIRPEAPLNIGLLDFDKLGSKEQRMQIMRNAYNTCEAILKGEGL